jgi:hypothetical protein
LVDIYQAHQPDHDCRAFLEKRWRLVAEPLSDARSKCYGENNGRHDSDPGIPYVIRHGGSPIDVIATLPRRTSIAAI